MQRKIDDGKPLVLAFCGYGRCGKDTACEWLRDHTKLVFNGGCSWTASPYMAMRLSRELGREVTVEDAYDRRHADRMKWYTYMNEYRRDDPARLIRDCLVHSNIICGIRDREELLAAREEGLLDLIIWIERDVPTDETVTYTVDDCDIILRNQHSLGAYYAKLWRLANSLGLEPAPYP